jgi:uncharacterized protein (DUF885 family)
MVRHRALVFGCACAIAGAFGCQAAEQPKQTPPPRESSDARVRALADAYLEGFLDRNPDQVTVYGIPGRRHDKLPDNSLDALRAWQAKEDGWLVQAKQIEPAAIDQAPLRGTYAIVREALEASIGLRPCRYELWTVSQMVNAWQVQDAYLVTIQPMPLRAGAGCRATSTRRSRTCATGSKRGTPRRRATSASSSIR